MSLLILSCFQLSLIRVNSRTCVAAISPDRLVVWSSWHSSCHHMEPENEANTMMSGQEKWREAKNWDIVEFLDQTMPNPANLLTFPCHVPKCFTFLLHSYTVGYCLSKMNQRSKTESSIRHNLQDMGGMAMETCRSSLYHSRGSRMTRHLTPLSSLFWVEHVVNKVT